MKKVLFIDYFFPPLAADWRGVAFAKLLPTFGWQPIVMSAHESVSYGKDYDLLKEIPEDLEVHRVRHREPSLLWQSVRQRLRISADFPDYYRTWYSPACREARKILREERIHLIYSASPTFTTAFVALTLKKEFKIPWVADFLDGWAVNDFLNLHYDQTLAKPLRWFQRMRVKRAERSILEWADKTVVISWHVKQRLCAIHRIEESKIEVVSDGYDESVFQGLASHVLYPDRLTITFLGSYYPPFREPIMKFLRVINQIEKNAEVFFIGRSAVPVHGMNMPNVTCILHLPRPKSLAFGLGSDFLFVVMPQFAKWIPTKIYDYIRLGRPILALVPEDGDAAKIVREARAGFILSHDQERMKRQLIEVFDKWRQGGLKDFHPDWTYVNRFERRRITERIAQLFDKVSL